MKPRPWATVGVLVLLLGMMASCEQPTVDPDEKYRDLLVGPQWITNGDPQNHAEPTLIFRPDGTANLNGVNDAVRWTLKKKTLTLVHSQGTDVTTSDVFAVSTTELTLVYLGGTCHLIPFTDQ